MPVLTTPRRITLYWLLLLVSTLVVGSGALLLLRREHARLAERSAGADAARQAALAARARLVVENIELFVGDVQAGLLDVLAAEPAEDLDAFLERWERDNPLVRVAFHADPAQRILWPDARAGEEARGFLRRFGQQFGARPPWGAPAEQRQKIAAPGDARQQQDEAEARKEVGLNVSQALSARRDVQELVKVPEYAASNFQNRQVAPSNLADASRGRDSPGRARPAANERSTSPERNREGGAAISQARSAPVGAAAPAPAPVPQKAEETIAQEAGTVAPDRRGWAPWQVDGRLHVLGWVQPGSRGDVRGVELELAALVSRLGLTLPAEFGTGEGYALRDERGRVMHQVGSVPRERTPDARVPLATAVLPGWDVVAYLDLPYTGRGDDRGFFWAGALLGAIFLGAILAGGSLLLWQARRSEAEAAQKTSFVANVSHEFKTPLTTIRLYSELLEQGRVRDTEQGRDYLRTIGRETQRLARLVNNALDFSRLEQGRKKYALEPIDLGAELMRLLDTHAPRVAEAGLALKRELPAAPLRVTTDRDALEQIVLNLVDNACKYAAAGGEVLVSAAPRAGGAGAEIRVADRGPGVPPEHRERIFDKFHRVDDALTAERTGAGLGLSIARQLARGLGGEIRHVPRAGGGAEFILELPT